jgi:leucyl-tRNA synthetase
MLKVSGNTLSVSVNAPLTPKSQPSTIQLETFPDVPEPSPELESISEYIKTTTSRVLMVYAGQQKRLAKGKGLLFDPSKDKCLNLYVAKSWPAWQQQYVDLVRDMFDGVTLNVKSMVKNVEKADMKRAMPFVQELKRRLEAGETAESVLDRTMAFDEATVLRELTPVLRSSVPGLKMVNVVVLEEQNQKGGITQVASSAEPSNPAIQFLNVPGVPSVSPLN